MVIEDGCGAVYGFVKEHGARSIKNKQMRPAGPGVFEVGSLRRRLREEMFKYVL